MLHWKKTCALLTALTLLLALPACTTAAGTGGSGTTETESSTQSTGGDVSTINAALTADTDFEAALTAVTYSDRDLTGEYYDSVTQIALGDGDVAITQPGTYVLSGTLSDGQVTVEVADTEKVQIVLSNASITNSDGPAIYVKEADKVFITLAEGTENTLSDGAVYDVADDANNPNACLFSQSDLTINGTGSLTIVGSYDHGVNSKDDLTITGGTLTVTATGDGLKGKDGVAICGGTITIDAGGDGIQSSNTDADKGWVSIEGGEIVISASGDGIQAESQLQITGGTIELTTGGGADNAETHVESFGGKGWFDTATTEETDTVSSKGLKAEISLLILGGNVTADCCDDALHCNGDIGIAGGTLTLSSGDDGVHADDALVIVGGNVTVTRSYEGLEGLAITISGGELDITASDDGLNAAGGDNAGMGGMFGADSFQGGSTASLTISGGTLYVNAGGDGLDSNGPLTVTGGETYVSGPSNGANGAIDCGDSYSPSITGGILVAAGASQMAETFGSESTQYSFLLSMGTTVAGGTQLTLTDESGNVLLTFTPENDWQCVVLSIPELTDGATYTVTAGETSASITLDGVTTSNGAMGGMGTMGGGMGGGGGRQQWQNGDATTGGTAPQAPADGTMPELPADGTMPEMPTDGTMPELPTDGTMPELPTDGTMPQRGGGGRGDMSGQAPADDGSAPAATGLPEGESQA